MTLPLAQNRPSGRWLFAVYAPALLLLTLTLLGSAGAGVPLAKFSRDPMATLNGHPLTGVQSTLGVLVWCGAAAICLFIAATVQHPRTSTMGRFFACSGAMTLLLALDDLFLFHEDLAERYLFVSEKPVLLLYTALVGCYLISFRRIILAWDSTLLVLALLFFGSSVGFDVLQGRWLSPLRIFIEDAFKLLGIVSWSGYLIYMCVHAAASAGSLQTAEEKGA